MLKLLICILFFDGLFSYKVHRGIHIRAAGDLSNDQLLEIDLYLRRYGYLDDQMPGTRSLASAENRKYALQFFQNFNKIPITGVYDDATANLFGKERCGCPDVMPQKNEAAFSKKKNPPTPVQFNLGTKWNKNQVTWRLNSFSRKISNNDVRVETRRAFDLWSKNANLQFTELQSGDADIDIDFGRREHGDGAGNAFDGPGRVLAHAFFPPFGDTHFDEDEGWVVNRTGVDYFTVAAHEFGHALGLGHSEIREALMAPFYTGYNPNFELNSDDIAGIQALYGAPRNQPRPRPTTPRTTMPPVVVTEPPPPRPPPTNRPSICDIPYNAAVRDFNGDLLVFMGRAYMLRIDPNRGLVATMTQRTVFQRSPIRPDAATEVMSGSRIVMMKGRLLYHFSRSGRRISRKWISGGGATMPEQARAALSFSSNDISVFGASQVWKLNPNTGRVISGSHRYIGNEFPGVPNRIDAAVIRDDRTILFFKGRSTMHVFDRRQNRVVRTVDKGNELMDSTCNV
ncbi:collagenase 3-like [Mytilus galloprovincialis]|uniref:collagenase 3-like n=1 Tax=Mytilus galloprovincialis TaxID=29158 RepID=UPI003F7BD7A1